jgi:hypothetical protein
VVNTEPLTAQRLCRAESAPHLAVIVAASGAIEVPHVIADDARLGERGFAGDMRAVRGMTVLYGLEVRAVGTPCQSIKTRLPSRLGSVAVICLVMSPRFGRRSSGSVAVRS